MAHQAKFPGLFQWFFPVNGLKWTFRDALSAGVGNVPDKRKSTSHPVDKIQNYMKTAFRRRYQFHLGAFSLRNCCFVYLWLSMLEVILWKTLRVILFFSSPWSFIHIYTLLIHTRLIFHIASPSTFTKAFLHINSGFLVLTLLLASAGNTVLTWHNNCSKTF